jgi:AcrR family transcriptional regulator
MGVMLKKQKLTSSNGRAAKRKPQRARRAPRSSQDILNRIVQAASQEFARHGFAGATTAAIARNADVTETQLFRYFKSKSELFHETIFKPLDEHFLNFISQHPPDDHPASIQEMATLYTSELQRFVSEHAETLTSLIVAQVYDSDVAQGMNRSSLNRYFARSESGLVRRSVATRINPKILVRVSFVAVLANILFKNWIFPRGLAGESEISDAINDFVWAGVSINFRK